MKHTAQITHSEFSNEAVDIRTLLLDSFKTFIATELLLAESTVLS